LKIPKRSNDKKIKTSNPETIAQRMISFIRAGRLSLKQPTNQIIPVGINHEPKQ
jgi:hypothetical protein